MVPPEMSRYMLAVMVRTVEDPPPSSVGLVTPGAGSMVTGEVAEVLAVPTEKPPPAEYTVVPGVTSSIVPPATTVLRAVVRVQASVGVEQSSVPTALAAAYKVGGVAEAGSDTAIVEIRETPPNNSDPASAGRSHLFIAVSLGWSAWVGVHMACPLHSSASASETRWPSP